MKSIRFAANRNSPFDNINELIILHSRLYHIILDNNTCSMLVPVRLNFKKTIYFIVLKTNPLFENRSKLFTLTIFAVIGILAIPVILPHIFHKFQILDPYLFNKTVNSIDYDFSVIEGKSDVIFHKSGKTGNDGSVTTISVP